MKNLIGLKWTGDLSLQDADVLVHYGMQSRNALEFGCGGSTQLLAQVCLNVTSVETVPEWIDVVRKRLANIENKRADVAFRSYTDEVEGMFDLIFVDGVKGRRLSFASRMWERLHTGGIMLFHDTRKDWGVELIKQFVTVKFAEIGLIDINAFASDGQQSNITVIQKRQQSPYIFWQAVENKPKWAYGSNVLREFIRAPQVKFLQDEGLFHLFHP